MREIRFRAWDKERRFMLYDFDQELPEYYGLRVGDSIHCKVYQVGMLFMTLTQYIGLKDKNGKDIYEGDIIGSTGHTNGVDNSVIEYGEFSGNLGFYRRCIKHGDIYSDWGMSWHYEVIGNIYEHTDLLK